MSSESGNSKRHHNPVNSLCRKIQAINMLDRTSNPTLQIPKFQSKNFDSPQGNVVKNLEEILKKRTLKASENAGASDDLYLLSPCSDSVFSPGMQAMTPSHRRISDIRLENATFSVGRSKEKVSRPWLLMGQIGGCLSPPCKCGELGYHRTEQKGALTQEYSCLTSSPSLVTGNPLSSSECVFQSPLEKRLCFDERAWRLSVETKEHENTDLSMVCEEDLLTTIFCACDLERRGKVAVSKIVDFLQYMTSRDSEDSRLGELCNMLDPEQRDISIDLETYHAIMKEWIEDCKQNWNETPSKETNMDADEPLFKLPGSILAVKRTPVRMNVTSGSLEALGGDVSKGDLETSDLITCVADLQFTNQKLHEENSQLKLTVDAMEEANNRLVEDSEGLRVQLKSFQQSVSRAKSLKEELEEAKNNLNASEEKSLKILAQVKQLEKENQGLILKVSSLQEENIQNALDTDGLQKKIVELSRNMTELQVQVHMYESKVENNGATLLKKDLDIQELKSTLKEYSLVMETLRVEKNKLMNDVRQMQQELISNGINFPLLYKFNSSILEGTNSLHCELQLAQEKSEVAGIEWSALDESLDKEVLLLLQGPEQVGEKFKATLQNLKEQLSQVEESALLPPSLGGVDLEENVHAYEKKLADFRQDLRSKRTLWLQKLGLLETQKECLDKELIKMAGNLRRMQTEQLHLKKELLLSQRELGSVKQLKDEAVAETEVLSSVIQELTEQLEDASKLVKGQQSDLRAACEEAGSLKTKLEESITEQETLRAANTNLTRAYQALESKAKQESTTFNLLREKHKGLHCRVFCKKNCCYKRSGTQETRCLFDISWPLNLRCWCLQFTPLVDALALDSLWTCSTLRTLAEDQLLCNGSNLDVMLEGCKCDNHSIGNQTDEAFVSSTRMEGDFTKCQKLERGCNAALICTSEAALKYTTESDTLESGVGPQTDVLSSREEVLSREVSPLASEDAKGLSNMVSTLPHPTEENVCKVTSVIEEAPAPAVDNGLVAGAVEIQARGDLATEDKCGISAIPNRLKTSASPSEKEVEAEFLRLSLGFKCDLFTLEKRVRLEERSRDLAEGNLRKEISSALKLLESLASLCEDNQAQEIAKKLQKSLELLNQFSTRVASRAEMLGAIHQESRVSKAVEVMIQHVENLKRTYAREHAELEELKEVLLQNEKSFSSSGDRDETPVKKGSLKAQFSETESDRTDKFNRRSNWSLVGAKQGDKRPSLQRYVTSHSWTESEDDQPEEKNPSLELLTPEIRGSKAQKPREKASSSRKWIPSMVPQVSSWASSLRTSFCKTNKNLYISVIAVVLLAVLSATLMGLSFQRFAEAAPMGTGSAWTSIQQLLWPYTGLRHKGPPPV